MYKGKLETFFQKSGWNVKHPRHYERQQPATEITADICDTIAMSLAYRGLFGGNPETVYKAKADVVMLQYNYMTFINDYQETELIINTPEEN